MKPLILVYADHPMCSIDCADATCDVLNESGLYNAQMIGRDSFPYVPFLEEYVREADCIVFPGGLGDVDQFDNHLTHFTDMIQKYVYEGGKYLGICQGSYFAGKHYFNLLRGYDSVQHIKTQKASTRRSGPAVVDINWKNRGLYPIYFHDGAAFVGEGNADVVARYKNGDAAALIQKRKKGKVAVMGPHPEAQKWWFYSQKKIKDGWKYSIQHQMLLELTEQLLDNEY